MGPSESSGLVVKLASFYPVGCPRRLKCKCIWLIVHFANKFSFSRLYNYILGRPILSLSQLSREYSALNTRFPSSVPACFRLGLIKCDNNIKIYLLSIYPVNVFIQRNKKNTSIKPYPFNDWSSLFVIQKNIL